MARIITTVTTTAKGNLRYHFTCNYCGGLENVKKLAHSQRSRQMWLGFGAFALLGIVASAC